MDNVTRLGKVSVICARGADHMDVCIALGLPEHFWSVRTLLFSQREHLSTLMNAEAATSFINEQGLAACLDRLVDRIEFSDRHADGTGTFIRLRRHARRFYFRAYLADCAQTAINLLPFVRTKETAHD